MKTPHIPSSVSFPFGYRVKVLQLPRSTFVDECGDDCMAMWVASEKTIYLDASRPIRKRRGDFIHELLHTFTDWQDWAMGATAVEVKG